MSTTIPTRADLEHVAATARRERDRADHYKRLLRQHLQQRRAEGWTDTMIEAEMIANSQPYEPESVYANRRSALDAAEPIGATVVQYSDSVVETRRSTLLAEVNEFGDWRKRSA